LKKKIFTIITAVAIAVTLTPMFSFATDENDLLDDEVIIENLEDTEITTDNYLSEGDIDNTVQFLEAESTESAEAVVIDVSQLANTRSNINGAINEALNNYDHIKLINFPEEGKEVIDTYPYGNDDMSAQGTIVYKVSNIKKLSNVYGADYLNVSGAPGITIGLEDSRTKSYSITIGSTFNCPRAKICNAAWGTTSAKTLTYSGTWKVPAKHNGKAVKRGHLHMRPEYSKKQFTVYSKVNGYTDWKEKGKSTTKRACGVDVYKTFTYK